ncbi:MAG TPA: STAS domain-containing protein [bacterium]|nr:STAS domain-containing protein [bacterium]
MSARRFLRRPRNGSESAGEFPWLSWRIKKTGDTVLLAVSGAADVETASVFARALDDATSYGLPIILDCSSLSHVDATGLDVLLEYRQRVPRMLLARPGATLRTTVSQQFLRGFLPAYDSLDTAMTALGVSPVRPTAESGCDARLFGRWRPRARRGRARR